MHARVLLMLLLPLHANIVRLIYRYLYHLNVNDCEEVVVVVVVVVVAVVSLIALAIFLSTFISFSILCSDSK